MKKKVTSGFVIAAKVDESESDILVDELHPCVCPNCCISKFEEGHEKDIVHDDFDCDSISTRCWGGFGEKRYKYLPHKCKACGTVFAPWVVEKKINGSVICYFIALIQVVAVAIITVVVAAAIDNPILLLGTVVMLMFMAVCIAGIETCTCCVCDPEKQISDKLKYAEITGKYLEENDETEDLDSVSAVSIQQAASACKGFSTQNMQAASEEQILAMQHIHDMVQANTVKRMNDVWRLHV